MKHKAKLIDTVFNADDAKEIVFTFINHKIQYHQMLILSMRERNIGNIQHSENRIAALFKAKEEVKKVIDAAKANGEHVKVSSLLEVSAVSDQKAETTVLHEVSETV